MASAQTTTGGKSGKKDEISILFEGRIGYARDERDQVQKKTFTKWINKHLSKINRHVDNLYEDLRDGHNLIALLEVLSGMTLPREDNYISHMRLPREKGRMRFHKLQNVQIALDFLKQKKLRLVNIRNDDITDGNPKLTLGLIWTIILHFQIEDISVEGWEDLTAKQALLIWAKRNMEGYDGINVTNFTSSWRDGKALNAILHRNRPEVLDIDLVMKNDNKTNLEQAFYIAEKEFGVTRLLDSEDVDVNNPDERSIITYVSSLYDIFPQVPEFPVTVDEQHWVFVWEEYRMLKTALMEWIQQQIVVMKRRDDIEAVETPTEAQSLVEELKRFEKEDLPPKEMDVQTLIPKYMDIEQLSLESRGKYQPCDGNEPQQVVSMFEVLIGAIDDRDAALTALYNRLKMLHELCMKITKSTHNCNEDLDEVDKLNQQIAMFTSDYKDLKIDADRHLSSCEIQIKEAFNDVQTVKDNNYYQAEEMYRMVFTLHERWVTTRSDFNLACQAGERKYQEQLENERTKLEETDDYLLLKQCLGNVESLKTLILHYPWGNDQPGIHHQIIEFEKVDEKLTDLAKVAQQCDANKNNLNNGSDDFRKYSSLLSQLHEKLDETEKTKVHRFVQLRELFEFVKEATMHLLFLNEKEDAIMDQQLSETDPATLEQHYMNLMGDVEAQESAFIATVKKGENILEAKHPAASVVMSYLTAMKDQWKFVLDLTLCLECHIADVWRYVKFASKCSDNENWLDTCERDLKKLQDVTFDNITTCEERLENREEFVNDVQSHGPAIIDIVKQCREVPCIIERHPSYSSVSQPVVKALCSYRSDKLAVAKGENCTIVSKANNNFVNVVTPSDQKGSAPNFILQYQPPSTECVNRADLLQQRYNKLCIEMEVCMKTIDIFVRTHEIQRKCQNVLLMDVHEYRNLKPEERELILISLSKDVKLLKDKANDLQNCEDHVTPCITTYQSCINHINDLNQQLTYEDDAQQQCQTYCSRLNVLLRRLTDLHDTVIVRIQTASLGNYNDVPELLADHKGSVDELERCEPHYQQVCSETQSVVEKFSSFPCSSTLNSQLDSVVKQWNMSWHITHVYLDKVKVVLLLIDDIKDTESVLQKVETTLAAQEDETDVARLKDQQKVFKSLYEILLKKDPVVINLKTNSQKLQELSTKFLDTEWNKNERNLAIQYPILSKEIAAYAETVHNISERWQICKVSIVERLDRILEVLPQVEKAAEEEQKALKYIEMLQALLKKMIDLESSQNLNKLYQLHQLPEDEIQALLQSQGEISAQSEIVKREYDTTQTEVVNFVNVEATNDTNYNANLREILHEVQNKWAITWLVVHVYLEKIKGILHIFRTKKHCDTVIGEYNSVIESANKPNQDIAEMKHLHQQMKSLLAQVPKQDSNFELLTKNFDATEDVVNQLPEEWKSGNVIEETKRKVNNTISEWEDVKENLKRINIQLEDSIDYLEKAQSSKNDVDKLCEKVAAFNSELNVICETQNSKILMPLSHDPSSLEKCLTQQKSVVDNIHLLSGKYFNLGAECSECKAAVKDTNEKMVGDAIQKLEREEELMHRLWQELCDRADLFKVKLVNLIKAVENLHDFENQTSSCENTLNSYSESMDVEKLRQHKEHLSELMSNVDKIDETEVDARSSVNDLTTTASELLKSSQTVSDSAEGNESDMDATKCSENFLSTHERWLKVKIQLCKQVELCGASIEKKEQEIEHETLLNSLLVEIKSLTDELKKIESSQVVRMEMMLPNDLVALNNIYDQQKERELILCENIEPRYSDLVLRCNQALDKQSALTDTAQLVLTEKENLTKTWQLVIDLVRTYFIKLQHIKALSEALSVAEPVLKKYKGKYAEVKGNVKTNSGEFMEPELIKKACGQLEEIKMEAKSNESVITDVSYTMESCQKKINDSISDQDFLYYIPAGNKLQEEWTSLFKDLTLLLTELRSALPEAERVNTMNASALNILAALKKMDSELEGMMYTLQAWMALTLSTDMDAILKAKSQHLTAQNRFNDILNEFKMLSSDAVPILTTSTPITHRLQLALDKVESHVSEVTELNSRYSKKLELLCILMEAVNVARTPLCRYEKELLHYVTMADNAEELHKQFDLFKELETNIPLHDPKFLDLKEKSDHYCEVMNLLNSGDQSSAQMYKSVSQNFTERWENAKKQISERLAYLTHADQKLSEIQNKTEGMSQWLDSKEPVICKAKESLDDSELIQAKIDEHEDIQNEFQHQSGNLCQIQDLVTDFDTTACKYDEVASSFDPPLPDGVEGLKQLSTADKEQRSKKRKTVIEYEIITVTRKYDRLKNLLSEKIDHYKVDFQQAKENEESLKNSTITSTTTEVTTTTTKRSYHDIKFNSFLKRKASLHDLHMAGLVSDDLAKQLEMGVVQEEEVQSQLQPFLTGSKPIAGLIVEKADNMKVSINTAIRHGLIKSGTGLVLLEAQAATGSMINPLTGELMSIEEAHSSGLIDSKYFDALQRAQKAVTGFEDPVTHQYLSLYECMKKGYIVESHGIRLLEAQIATGGLIDPRANHRVPISVAYKRGLFDERMNQILEDPSDDTKGFFDPNSQKNLTYLELMGQCKIDPESNLIFLVLTRPNINVESLLSGTKKRSRADIRFVTAYYQEARLQDIYDAGLVTEEQVKGLEEGNLTESDLENQLKVYLFGGEEPIAGVMIEESGEMLSIAEAARKGIIKRGTAIELLEAQAATGNIVDPKTGNKMSVEQAYNKGLIDRVHVDTLERAQRAVRGYPVAGTKQILSLFEAMRKGLVVESRGIRLLEAQIATGGLIDPRAHHRVPISVAYKRGLFDERMNDILEDPSDDTKGFFDPNTQENLSYLDLMERCEVKGEHNLRFLILKSNRKSRRAKAAESTKNKKKNQIRFQTAFGTDVSLMDLKWLDLIQEDVLQQANDGTIPQSQLENELKSNLQGSHPICGVMIENTKEKLSFLEAMNRKYLDSETALNFLEAQVCCGGITDTKTMESLSVQDAYMSGIIDRHQHSFLAKPESFVHGVWKNGKQMTMSAQENITNGLLQLDQVVKYLNCQLATGGIIEPSTKVRIPKETALKLGIINNEIYQMLEKEDSSFKNPTTQQCTTYHHILSQCETQMHPFLLLNIKGSKTDRSTNKLSRTDIFFETTLSRSVSLVSLLDCGIVSESSVKALEDGLLTKEELFSSIQQYLVGEQPIAGIRIEATGQKLSILECIQNGIIKRGTGLELLEAQAAIGCIIDPVSGEQYSVIDALTHGLIDKTQKDTLERAQRAVLGYKDPVSGKKLSLFEAMNKGYVTESRGIRLLEAQIATGGLIDPTISTRVPLSVAYKRGIINGKMFKILTDPSDDTKGFFDPNTEENLTYLELMSRCMVEPSSGLVYLALSEKKKRRSRKSDQHKKKKKTTHRSRKVVIIDPDTGNELSIKEAYKKGFIDKASAYQLMEQEGEWKEEALEKASDPNPLSPLSPVKSNKPESSSFSQLQGMVSADDLSARLMLLSDGQFQPIAGIVDVRKEECITIGEAEKRRLIDGTSAQRLYEAQAATGGIIDPSKPTVRLSVNQAIAAGLIERRVAQRIGNAEKAFCGFPDKRANIVLTLGQAIKKGLCYYESGTRLLEYQCVTGGLVDPADGSRVTLEQALAKGWLDQKMVDRLSDLSRYTKSIVDLKTNLLMTYPDALEKSVVDSATGIRMLEALPRLERNVKLGGVTIQASSAFTSLASSLASSRAESPVGSRRASRRGSFER
uniref:Plectin n=1 Tax=Phallusia mammillata TaxID=59560 RepID=A0A6F9DPW2_9ASCI|nr:plectin [Phallusia mammillata]